MFLELLERIIGELLSYHNRLKPTALQCYSYISVVCKCVWYGMLLHFSCVNNILAMCKLCSEEYA